VIRAGGAIIARHPVLTGLGGLLAAMAVLLVIDGGGEDPVSGDARAPDTLLDGIVRAPAPAPEPGPSPVKPAREPDPPRRFQIATVRPGAAVALRSSPGGSVVAVAGSTTEWNSERSFWVERRRGDWLGVPAPELPNGSLAWIRRTRALDVSSTGYSILADISQRRVRLRSGNRTVHSFPVAVGAPGSPTPPGRYAVTDGLVARGDYQAFYGCCVLALTGHQPNLPSYWIGADRIAIHGTGSAGSTAGCLRGDNANLVRLFRTVPLGTPVIIRR
jgi:hypothetical protein